MRDSRRNQGYACDLAPRQTPRSLALAYEALSQRPARGTAEKWCCLRPADFARALCRQTSTYRPFAAGLAPRSRTNQLALGDAPLSGRTSRRPIPPRAIPGIRRRLLVPCFRNSQHIDGSLRAILRCSSSPTTSQVAIRRRASTDTKIPRQSAANF